MLLDWFSLSNMHAGVGHSRDKSALRLDILKILKVWGRPSRLPLMSKTRGGHVSQSWLEDGTG